MKVLSTKALDENIIAAAAAKGITLSCIDFIQIKAVPFDTAAFQHIIYDAVVFTSSNGVKCFFENETISSLAHNKPVYAISQKTKEALINYGITPVALADNAAALANVIVEDNSVRSVLHICGNLTLDTLQTKLMQQGLSYVALVVYENTPAEHVIKETFDAVMFYSPSSVQNFVNNNGLNPDTLYCCIGETTAAKLKSINDKIDIILPKQPSPEAMISAIEGFKKSMDKI